MNLSLQASLCGAYQVKNAAPWKSDYIVLQYNLNYIDVVFNAAQTSLARVTPEA